MFNITAPSPVTSVADIYINETSTHVSTHKVNNIYRYGQARIRFSNEELTRDLISIITSFSARLYGLRSHKMKNILEAVRE